MAKQPYTPYLTTGEAARELGITPQYVRILARKGKLPFHSTQFGRIYPADAVEKLRKEREAAA